MKILISGGAGYIGSSITNFLIRKGAKVSVIDNLKNGNKKFLLNKCKFYKADINSETFKKNVLKKNHFDLVIHCAALTDNNESIKYPKLYYSNNYLKAKKFIRNCIETNCKNFIISSTAAIYGNRKNKCIETGKINPQTPYAKSKLKLENFVKKKDINYAILRYFNVVGVEQKLRSGFNVKNESNLFVSLCKACFEKKFFLINGNNHLTNDKTPVRDFIYIEDLVKIHYFIGKLMQKKKVFKKIVNCGYGKGLSVLDTVKYFKKYSKFKLNFIYTHKRKKDISYSVASNDKLLKIINFKPTKNYIKKMVLTSLKWYFKVRKYR